LTCLPWSRLDAGVDAWCRPALGDNAWIQDITSALTVLAIIQYVQLWERVKRAILQPGTGDRTKWNMDVYSAGSAYAAKFHGQMALLGAKETRKLKALILHLVGAPGPMLDVQTTKATWIMCLVHTQCSESIDHLLFVWLHFQWRSFTTTEYVYSIGW
jgi:hypothetical protein